MPGRRSKSAVEYQTEDDWEREDTNLRSRPFDERRVRLVCRFFQLLHTKIHGTVHQSLNVLTKERSRARTKPESKNWKMQK